MLRLLRPDEAANHVSLRDILGHVGDRSFTTVILLTSLVLVSPVSAIPGMPTMGMLIIVGVAVQYLLGRSHLWLPAFVLNRQLQRDKVERAIDFLHGPMSWIDRRTKERLSLLTHRPLKWLVVLTIMATALPWPVLEPLPMVTSIGATAVSLLAIGLVTRDGIFVVLGFAFIGGMGTAVYQLWERIW
jgi:hypothetical protein